MQIDDETAEAIRVYIQQVQSAQRLAPDEPIKMLFACACRGPMPECRCAKRNRLVRSFLESKEGE